MCHVPSALGLSWLFTTSYSLALYVPLLSLTRPVLPAIYTRSLGKVISVSLCTYCFHCVLRLSNSSKSLSESYVPKHSLFVKSLLLFPFFLKDLHCANIPTMLFSVCFCRAISLLLQVPSLRMPTLSIIQCHIGGSIIYL